MALTIEEQHETNDLDHDILARKAGWNAANGAPTASTSATRHTSKSCLPKSTHQNSSRCGSKKPLLLRPAGKEAKAWFDEHRDDEGAIVFEGSEEIADEELYVNDRNDEHCGLSLSGSASERL